MASADAGVPATWVKDGRGWQIGTQTDIAWIAGATRSGLTIRSGIPAVFEAYATVVLPRDAETGDHERRLMRLLMKHSAEQPWWLGYLDTGSADVVFPDAPRVLLYANWPYVLVKAGPEQAQQWRAHALSSPHSRLPDLMFPADRSWLLSALWDDDWWCFGGPADLVAALQSDPGLEVRIVRTEDATPPGHTAR